MSVKSEAEILILWQHCLKELRNEIPSKKFTTCIQPLHAESRENELFLLAPNQFVMDWVQVDYFSLIEKTVQSIAKMSIKIKLEIGTKSLQNHQLNRKQTTKQALKAQDKLNNLFPSTNSLNPSFSFENFVVGKSNALGRAAACQITENPGKAYNPLFLYGGVGLGKTHLMHAMGNRILENDPNSKILYLHSERFVGDMIKALQRNKMTEFKRFYRSVNALLIDDIQFFAGKERSQEEFFHTFNSLLDADQQIVLTCDRYPKEINGLEERLQSRFGWGLTIAIEPPELETRVAILISKAEHLKICLPDEVAFFIGKHIQSNIRELEGALKRLAANAQFSGQEIITIDFTRNVLKDLLALQARLITVNNIQKTVAEYYKIKISDMISKKRSRSVTRPRQMAMTLAKELTSHSLPEIGEAFGGRDHTTVLHACRKIKELSDTISEIQKDYKNLLRILSA